MTSAMTAPVAANGMATSRTSGLSSERKVGEQILRLQAHDIVVVGGDREVDRTARDLGAHRVRIREFEPE